MGFLSTLAKGLISYIPGTKGLFGQRRVASGSYSARYCYSVWLRHLCLSKEQGLLEGGVPRVVAEIGPGHSLGVGIAALLSGCEEYRAFDMVQSADITENIRVLDELVYLFRTRFEIPDDVEFPEIYPRLSSYGFPDSIISKESLQVSLNQQRIEQIRNALKNMMTVGKYSKLISYTVPWSTCSNEYEADVDMIISQAVMEHVEDLEGSYLAMFRWLKSGGFISHQIDFRSHGVSSIWNGHWSYPQWLWALIKGRRPYLINRQPLSTHEEILTKCGFKIVGKAMEKDTRGIEQNKLSRDFAGISDEALVTCSALVLATKNEAQSKLI